jgi:hypothetical protein
MAFPGIAIFARSENQVGGVIGCGSHPEQRDKFAEEIRNHAA